MKVSEAEKYAIPNSPEPKVMFSNGSIGFNSNFNLKFKTM